MEKTYSQKVAHGFAIIGYLLMIPTIIGLIFPVIGLFVSIFTLSPLGFLGSLIPFLIVAPGVGLLIGYGKHAFNELDEDRVPALWIGTAVYNFLLLLPWLFFSAQYFQSSDSMSRNEVWFSFSMSAGYLTAIVFSLNAYMFGRRQKHIRRFSSVRA